MEKAYISNESTGTTEYFTIFVGNSESTLTLNNQNFEMDKGCFMLTREGNSYSVAGNVNVLMYRKEFFDSIFISQIADSKIIYDMFQIENPQNEHLFFDYDFYNPAYDCSKIVMAEISHDGPFREKLVRIYTSALLTHLEQSREAHLVVNKSTMLAEHRFGKIMKYIGENYKDISLAEVSEKFGYNPDYLSTRFKIITNQTFTEKLREIRMEQACNILERTDLSVEEVSLEVGFKDKSFFMKKFKERYGVTPGKYRKIIRQRLN